jgi:hypothetical protein
VRPQYFALDHATHLLSGHRIRVVVSKFTLRSGFLPNGPEEGRVSPEFVGVNYRQTKTYLRARKLPLDDGDTRGQRRGVTALLNLGEDESASI